MEHAKHPAVANIQHTEVVDAAHTDRLWSKRRRLFFKPAVGYGGRATYRGDKMTRRVRDSVLAGSYVAPAIIVLGERVIGSPESPQALKFDIRTYVCDGQVQWTAARAYQGQTTNFRMPGGRFVPVYSLPDSEIICEPEVVTKDLSSLSTEKGIVFHT